jgi:hypothetical protein
MVEEEDLDLLVERFRAGHRLADKAERLLVKRFMGVEEYRFVKQEGKRLRRERETTEEEDEQAAPPPPPPLTDDIRKWTEDRSHFSKGRWTKEEDETLKQAVEEYAQQHALTSKAIKKYVNMTSEQRKSLPDKEMEVLKGVWKFVGQSLRTRSLMQISDHAHALFSKVDKDKRFTRLNTSEVEIIKETARLSPENVDYRYLSRQLGRTKKSLTALVSQHRKKMAAAAAAAAAEEHE